jgi:hypothetical protein
MFWSFERDPLSIETEGIREWRAIFTLIVFVLTSKSCCFESRGYLTLPLTSVSPNRRQRALAMAYSRLHPRYLVRRSRRLLSPTKDLAPTRA